MNSEWFSTHAARLQALLDAPFPSHDNMMIWRGVYRQRDEAVVTRFSRMDGSAVVSEVAGQVSIQPVTVRSTRWRSTDVMQGDMDGYEITAFLGLDSVDPASFEWRREKLAHAPRKGTDLAVVRGSLPQMQTDGRR